MSITTRPISDADTEACGRIIYEAFKGFHDRHRFRRDFQTLEDAVQLAGLFVNHPAIFGVVAEIDRRVVGSNFIDERNSIRGIGPITVAPDAQGRGVGRRLMAAVLERGKEAAGIRLVQDAFNMLSLSLYASLGFEVKEPLALVEGKPKGKAPADVEVRLLRSEDLKECASLCTRVHGFDRTSELRGRARAFFTRCSAARRPDHCVCLGAVLLETEPRRRRDGGRHAGAHYGRWDGDHRAAGDALAGAAGKLIPMVSRRDIPGTQANDADDDGHVPRAEWMLFPFSFVLNRTIDLVEPGVRLVAAEQVAQPNGSTAWLSRIFPLVRAVRPPLTAGYLRRLEKERRGF